MVTSSSMSSAFDRSIRRQQYRFTPSSSRTVRGLSPARVRVTNGSQREPTTLPHVKHLTGMIIGSPVRLLPLLPGPAAEGVLRELPPGVGDDQGAVVVPVQGLEVRVVQVRDEPPGDRRPGRVRLAHDPAPEDPHRDVDALRLLPRELEGLEDLQARELGLVDLHGDAVHADHAAPFRHGGAGDRGLPLPAREDDLHAAPPRRSAISRRVKYFADLITGARGRSRGLSLSSAGISMYTRSRIIASRPRASCSGIMPRL